MRRLLVSLLILAGCGPETSPETSAESSAATATRSSVHQTSADPWGAPSFRWATGSAPAASDDPVAAARAHLIRLGGAPAAVVEQASLRSVHRIGAVGTIVQLYRRHEGVEVVPSEVRVLMRDDLSLVAVSGALPADVAPSKQDGLHVGPKEALTKALGHALGREVGVAEVGAAEAREDSIRFEARAPSALVLPYGAEVKTIVRRDADGPRWAYRIEFYAGDADERESRALRYVLAAADGRRLEVESLTQDVAFEYRVYAENTGDLRPFDGPVADYSPHPAGVPDGTVPGVVPSNLVSVEAFNRNPTGGVDPWLSSSARETRGNNVDAYMDHNSPDGFTNGDQRATTTRNRAFDHAFDPTLEPAANETQIMGSITQLFYTINWLHDYWYDSGFDEAAGNAQQNNFERGGEGGDAMRAEAQDSLPAGTRNNANMSTPSDGTPPRMQVYVWTQSRTANVQLGGASAPFGAGVAGFGPTSFSLTGPLVLADDGSGTATDACQPLTNNVVGQIVLVDRGNCSFSIKAVAVQNAGGIGMVLANNRSGGPPAMGGTPPTPLTIPVLSITQADGNTVKGALQSGPTTVTLTRIQRPDVDASLDGSLVAHEWGHYLHHRLAVCGNDQCRGMSEGWGDFLGLHTVVREGDDLLTGTYASAGYATIGRSNGVYFGVRRYAYSIDPAKNALSFRHIEDGATLPGGPMDPSGAPNSQVHNTGEIWASMLFEGYVGLLDTAATSTTGRTFEDTRRVMADYVVASLMMTPDNATFTEARDALLAAAFAANAADFAILAEAFARRGAGTCAVSPDRAASDHVGVVEDFALTAQLTLQDVDFGEGGFSCDQDGVLDVDERGLMRLSVSNGGHRPLLTGQVVLTSSTGHLLFGGGGTIAVPALDPLASTTLEVPVTVAPGAAGPRHVGIGIRLESPDGCAPVQTSTVYVVIDRDEVANQTVDTVEATGTTWTLDGGLASSIWSRPEHAPFDRSWRGIDYATHSDSALVSPPLEVGTSTSFVVTLDHRYQFEADAPDGSDVNWDGAVIELSTDDGATWQDVETWVGPGYRGTLTDRSGNPLADRRALVGSNPEWPGFAPLRLDFGTTFAGQTLRLRFRIGTDAAVGDYGLELDNLAFAGIDNTPFLRVVPDATLCPPELVADAGEDQAAAPLETVLLDGSGSSSFHGRALTFSWRQTAGPTVTLQSAGGAFAALTAPSAFEPSTLTFELTVDDGTLQATDTLDVVVEAAPRPAVAADAGADQAVEPGAPVVLDGSSSVGPSDMTFTWTQVDGPDVTLAGADRAVARFDAPSAEQGSQLVFRLTVEANGLADRAETTVTVGALDAIVADAGLARTVAAGATVVLDASGSRGPPGLGFEWRQTAGPDVELSTSAGPVAVFEAPTAAEASTLDFEVRVFEGAREATATVRIEVEAQAPVVAPPLEEDGCRCVRPPSTSGWGALWGLLGLALLRRRRT